MEGGIPPSIFPWLVRYEDRSRKDDVVVVDMPIRKPNRGATII